MRLFASSAVLAFALALTHPAAAAPGYLRYPDILGNMIVFVAESDLWLTSDRGGASRRLTTYEGSSSSRFSPDSLEIAFTGEYDGKQLAMAHFVDVFVGILAQASAYTHAC